MPLLMGLKLFNNKCEGWECWIERIPKVTFILSNKKRDLEVALSPEVVQFSLVVERVVVLEITCMKGEFKTGRVVMSSRIKAVTTEKFMNLSFGKFLTEKINQLW